MSEEALQIAEAAGVVGETRKAKEERKDITI